MKKPEEPKNKKYIVVQNEPKVWVVYHKKNGEWIEDNHYDNADDAYARQNILNMSKGIGVIEIIVAIYLISAAVALATGHGGY